MGWLPAIFGGESDSPADPFGKLDPKLREFLEKESPVKYTPTQLSPSPAPQLPKADTPVTAEAERQEPVVPSASLYQDGRYAHLWKTYKPLSQVEAETSSDHDKMAGVIDGLKERKSAIGKAALENCSLQQEEWINCMKHGSWEDQLQMCRHQVRRFEKCHTMQSRFLRALGFGSVVGRPFEVDEDIQMHADRLFQRVQQHEVAVEQAREAGQPIPVFDPVVPRVQAPTIRPTEEIEQKWKERLQEMPEDERAAEEAALRADYQSKTELAHKVRDILDIKKKEREERQAKGQGTLSDTLTGLFGFGGSSSENDGKQ